MKKDEVTAKYRTAWKDFQEAAKRANDLRDQRRYSAADHDAGTVAVIQADIDRIEAQKEMRRLGEILDEWADRQDPDLRKALKAHLRGMDLTTACKAYNSGYSEAAEARARKALATLK